MTKNESLHFIITGGTIDSFYDGVQDTVVPNKESVIPEFIESLKLYHDTKFTVVCMKDSRSMDEHDREALLKAIEASPSKRIIVTHGTYTMPDTARYLKANLKRKDQVIILTGSMIPIKGFSPSDGPFNLGYSASEATRLGGGIYVCMNGNVFQPEEVMKLLYEGRFASVFNNQPNPNRSN
jgi:L-asparaginase